ncbi:PAS domain S-box protein [candidate division GN15 bacterium]|nr:PAS domain S-box protein [candidate division GN15 bacterium]
MAPTQDVMAETVNDQSVPANSTSETPVKSCAVCKVDLRGRFVYVDSHVEAMFGLSQEELFGRELKEFVDECHHEVVDRLLVRHSRFETFFETADLLLYDANGRPVPASTIVSLNFVAGNPVNFQVVFHHIPEHGAQTASAGTSDHATDYWQSAATILAHRSDIENWSEHVGAWRELADASEVLIYDLTGEEPRLVCTSSDPGAVEPSPMHAGDLTQQHRTIIAERREYTYTDSDQNREMVERFGRAPSEYLYVLQFGNARYLLRFDYPEDGDTTSVQQGIERLRLLIPILERTEPAPAEQPEPVPIDELEHRLAWLDTVGVAACVCSADLHPQRANLRLHELLPNETSLPESVDSLLENILSGDEVGRRRRLSAALRLLPEQEAADGFATHTRLRNGSAVWARVYREASSANIWLFMVTLPDEVWAGDGGLRISNTILPLLQRCIDDASADVTAFAHIGQEALDVQQRIHLVGALDTIQRATEMTRFTRSATEYLSHLESPATTDLNLLATQTFEQLRRSYPDKTVNLSFRDLPTIVAPTRQVADLLNAWAAYFTIGADRDPVDLTFEATTSQGAARLILGLNGQMCLTEPGQAVVPLPWSLPETAGLSIPGAHWLLSQALVERLGGKIEWNESDGVTRVIVELPDHA